MSAVAEAPPVADPEVDPVDPPDPAEPGPGSSLRALSEQAGPRAKTQYRVFVGKAVYDALPEVDANAFPADAHENDLAFLADVEAHDREGAIDAALAKTNDRLRPIVERVDAGQRVEFVVAARSALGVVPVEVEVVRRRKIGGRS